MRNRENLDPSQKRKGDTHLVQIHQKVKVKVALGLDQAQVQDRHPQHEISLCPRHKFPKKQRKEDAQVQRVKAAFQRNRKGQGAKKVKGTY